LTLKDEIAAYSAASFADAWSTRDGKKVPVPGDIGAGNDGVWLDAAILYADLNDSTGLVSSQSHKFAAEVYKSYTYMCARIISKNGTVSAYDGDRVMGVFIGDTKCTNAIKAAQEINYARRKLIQPALNSVYGSTKYTIEHTVGVDTSKVLVANAGVRGNNDFVWVGIAANRAAKLSSLKRSTKWDLYVTDSAHRVAMDSAKVSSTGQDMWTDLGTADIGVKIWGSDWGRTI
jgi:class 3 adenylate cyclase